MMQETGTGTGGVVLLMRIGKDSRLPNLLPHFLIQRPNSEIAQRDIRYKVGPGCLSMAKVS